MTCRGFEKNKICKTSVKSGQDVIEPTSWLVMEGIVFVINDHQSRFISENVLSKRMETMTFQKISLTLSQVSFCLLDRATYEVVMEFGIKAVHVVGGLVLSSPKLFWLLRIRG